MIVRQSEIFIAAALAAAALLSGCGQASEAQTPPPGPPQVEVAPAVRKPVRDVEEFTGRLEAPESVDLRGRVGGTIEKISFRDGATVHAGDLLFSIDSRPYEAEVARDEAQLEVVKAQADLARADLARADKLLDARAVSRQEYDQLTEGARSSDANVRAAEAALRVARLNLEYTAVRAPIGGRISRANVTVGNLIDDKTVLTTLVSTDRVYAYFDGSEATYLKLRGVAPQQLQVRMGLADESGLPHTGRLDFIDNRLNPQTGAIRLRAVFDNRHAEFTPGLFARMQLADAVAHERVLTPDRAVGTDQSKNFVFVVAANHMTQFREIHPGALVGGMRVVESGLEPGELVIVSGVQRVRPGVPVNPQTVPLDGDGMPVDKPAPGGPAGTAPTEKS